MITSLVDFTFWVGTLSIRCIEETISPNIFILDKEKKKKKKIKKNKEKKKKKKDNVRCL